MTRTPSVTLPAAGSLVVVRRLAMSVNRPAFGPPVAPSGPRVVVGAAYPEAHPA